MFSDFSDQLSQNIGKKNIKKRALVTSRKPYKKNQHLRAEILPRHTATREKQYLI